MPKDMENALKEEAINKFGTTDSPSAKALIYGTMRKTGWKPKQEKFGKHNK